VIRDEDRAAEAAGDATDDVNDADTQPTKQLLHVSHEQQLKDDADLQLQNPTQHTLTHIRMFRVNRRRRWLISKSSFSHQCVGRIRDTCSQLT